MKASNRYISTTTTEFIIASDFPFDYKLRQEWAVNEVETDQLLSLTDSLIM